MWTSLLTQVNRCLNWPTWPINTTLMCSFLGASGWVGGTLGTGDSSSSSIIISGASSSAAACTSGPLSPPPGSSSSGSASFWSHGSSVLISVSPFSRAHSAQTGKKRIDIGSLHLHSWGIFRWTQVLYYLYFMVKEAFSEQSSSQETLYRDADSWDFSISIISSANETFYKSKKHQIIL